MSLNKLERHTTLPFIIIIESLLKELNSFIQILSIIENCEIRKVHLQPYTSQQMISPICLWKQMTTILTFESWRWGLEWPSLHNQESCRKQEREGESMAVRMEKWNFYWSWILLFCHILDKISPHTEYTVLKNVTFEEHLPSPVPRVPIRGSCTFGRTRALDRLKCYSPSQLKWQMLKQVFKNVSKFKKKKGV